MPDTKHRVAIAEVELIGKIKEWKFFIVWMLVRYGMYWAGWETNGQCLCWSHWKRMERCVFCDIQKTIGDISQRMLTVTLRSLETDGLIVRKVYAEVPPRVEYNLTETGCSLMPHIESLVGWALEHMNDILNRRSLQNWWGEYEKTDVSKYIVFRVSKCLFLFLGIGKNCEPCFSDCQLSLRPHGPHGPSCPLLWCQCAMLLLQQCWWTPCFATCFVDGTHMASSSFLAFSVREKW